MNITKESKVLFVIMMIALAVRVAAIMIKGISTTTFGDTSDYLLAANALCTGNPYPEATELPFFRAPGYPFFLATTSLCHLDSIALLKIITVALDLFCLLGVMHIARQLKFSDRSIFIAAMLYALSPFLIGQTIELQSELLFQAGLIACSLGIVRRSYPATFLAGAALGLAALTRPIGLGFLPLILLMIAHVQKRLALGHFLSLMTGMAFLIAPWSYYNYTRTSEFILINDAFGYNVWRGSHPVMQQIYQADNPAALQALSNTLEHELTPAITAQTTNMSRRQRNQFFTDAAWQQIISNPSATAHLLLTKIRVYLRPWLDPAAWNKSIVILTGLWESLLYLTAAVAFARLWRHQPRLCLLIAAYFLMAIALSLPFQVVARFRIPFYEWVLILLVAYEIGHNKPNEQTLL